MTPPPAAGRALLPQELHGAVGVAGVPEDLGRGARDCGAGGLQGTEQNCPLIESSSYRRSRTLTVSVDDS